MDLFVYSPKYSIWFDLPDGTHFSYFSEKCPKSVRQALGRAVTQKVPGIEKLTDLWNKGKITKVHIAELDNGYYILRSTLEKLPGEDSLNVSEEFEKQHPNPSR